MIELRTGVPGSGKTLSMVESLSKLFKRWETHPEEARPVFVHNIPNLAFPVASMPLVSVAINKGVPPVNVPDWDSMPDGSLVLIDECQGDISKNENIFPPRASASIAPKHIAWLNTHRHKGFDLWITTQHPKLIDSTVRALVGKHQHFRRVFGGARAICYEWDACSDSLSNLKNAVSSYWSYPKQVYKWYKSAEIHTKQKFKIPRWAFVPVLGLIGLVVFVPRAYNVMFGDGLKHHSTAAVASVSPSPSTSSPAPLAALAGGALAPTVAASGVPSSAPAVASVLPGQKPDSVERKVSDLKISDGVYSDDPKVPAHFTPEELRRQAAAVACLERFEEQGRYVPRAVPPSGDRPASPIFRIDPHDHTTALLARF